MGALAAGGFVVGLTASLVENEVPGGVGTFPPGFAIAATALFVLLVGGGSWRYFRQIDEVERRNNYVGATWGANLYMIVYPSWWMLWKGGLVIEPAHEILFAIMLVGTYTAYVWHKYRS
ncbi:MAG: hypothetical protein B7Y45_10750 [Sphingomonas sp. 28-66-16]|nr:MAG: hypothetical protein B7Y45_10750 [Sphingomonas sp. 28-66-16]